MDFDQESGGPRPRRAATATKVCDRSRTSSGNSLEDITDCILASPAENLEKRMLIIHRRILATTPRPSLPSSTTTSAVASDALILCGQGGKKTKRGSVLKTKHGRDVAAAMKLWWTVCGGSGRVRQQWCGGCG
ncbi:hypothetical protein QYF36_004349 [Acer negundo]|nr:hypothetical protein QYF36_004349 [Acer negundo]